MNELPRPLGLLGVLSAVAGFVDAAVFTLVADVFVANQSGNVILFGMALGGRGGADFYSPATSLVCFGAGVALTAAVMARRRNRGALQRADVAAGLEVGLLVALAVAVVIIAGDGRPATAAGRVPIVAIGAVAMGTQTLLLRRVHGVAVSTTYASGAVARIGETAGLLAAEAGDSRARLTTIGVLGVGITAYLLGAIVAAAVVAHTGIGTAVLWAPPAVLAAVAVWLGIDGLSRRRRP